MARGYHKLLAYKDEYEVARLYTDGAFKAQLEQNFDGVTKIEFHLAPPLLSWFKRDKETGHPRKMTFGPWMMWVFRQLAKAKSLRGTRWDVFGYTAERRHERQMIADYEALLDRIGEKLSPQSHATAVVLAGLPMEVRGFGHVKAANYERAKAREAELLAELENPAPVPMAAE